MFDRNLTMRIDENTNNILDVLANDQNFSKAEIIRRSLRLMTKLNEIQKKYGELKLTTSKGKEILVLLG